MSKLDALERFGWSANDVILTKKDGEDLTAATWVKGNDGHTGGMIALVPSEADLDRLVLESGEPREELHLTLLFLGEAAELPDSARQVLVDELTTIAGQRDAVTGDAFAVSMFNPAGDEPCWVLGCSGEELAEQHLAATAAGSAASVDGWSPPEQHSPWVPHITLIYTDETTLPDNIADRLGPIRFDRLRLAVGDEVLDLPLGELAEEVPMPDDDVQADAGTTHSLVETNTYSLLRQRFMGAALERAAVRNDGGWTDMPAADVAATVDSLLTELDVNRTENASGWQAWFGTSDVTGVLAWVELDSDGSWSIVAAGPDRNTVVDLTNSFKAALPSAMNADDGQIAVQFWAMGPMGPLSYGRRLAASRWDDVKVNYGTKLGSSLDELMAMKPPEDGGRLMLWHGPPGTGKTHALRALAHEWRDWCDVDYIIDADEFFEHASYMVSSLVMNESSDDRWRLVVIEDAGRYLLSNAQDKIGEGLGRLLNLADGLVGQGLRQLILMTTNEPVEEFHAAITRPGRCRSNLRFGPLSRADANRWLGAHGAKRQVKEPKTLAELYAMSGLQPITASFGLPSDFMQAHGITASETQTKPQVTFTTARIRAATLLDIPAFVEARLELTGPPDENGFAPWAGPLTVEGIPTGDGRLYAEGCFRWEDPSGDGWPLRWDVEDDGMHLGAVRVGRIDTMERAAGGLIMGTGVIDTNTTWGMACYGMMERKMLSGVSVDMDDIPEESVEVDEQLMASVVGSDDLPLADEGTEWDPDAAHSRIVELAAGDVGVLARGHLWVPEDADPADPASYQVPFADVISGELTAVPAGIDWAATAIADVEMSDDDREAANELLGEYFERLADDDEVEVVDEELEASAWGQFRELPRPPAAMFTEPPLADTDEYVHYENGRIYGWVAQAGVCHDGISGKCVTPPLGRVDLSTFLRQPLELDDGSVVRVGAFTMGTGHHNDGAASDSLRALFDDTRTVAGIVTVGVKRDANGRDVGMWFSGVAAPWLSDWDRTVFAACRPSGHWRRLRSGGWSLRAVLSVPVPGFPNKTSPLAPDAVVNRSNIALAASALPTPQPIKLPPMSAGTITIVYEGGSDANLVQDGDFLRALAGALADEMEERQRIRAEVDELSASLNDARHRVAASLLTD